MATFTHLDRDYAFSNPVTSASLTADNPCALHVMVQDSNGTGNPSVSGCGMTWNLVRDIALDATTHVFHFIGTGTMTTGTLSISGGDAEAFAYVVTKFTNCNTSSPVVQSAISSGTSTAPATTLSAFEDAANATFAAMCSAAASVEPGTGFTELFDGAAIFDGGKFQTEYVAANDTSPDSSLSASVAWTFAAFEIDESAGGTVNTNTLTDTVAVADEPLDYVFASRLGSDDVVVVDSPTESFSIHNISAISETVVTDDFLAWLRRHRVLDDSVTITDELISTVIGYLIYTSVLTSNVSVTDEAMKMAYFYRLVDSGIVTEDQLLRAVLVARDLLDSVEVSDSGLTSIQRFILLTDTISVEDSLLSTYVPYTPVNPLIRIGFDQPEVKLGGYSVN